MKKLILVIGVLLGFIFSYGYNEPESMPAASRDSEDLLRRIVSDSISPLLKDNPLLLYTIGHYGYSWTILAKIDKNIRIFSGKISYDGDNQLTDTEKINQLDTCALLMANESLFNWAFDSLATEALRMIPIERDYYMTLYTSLMAFNTDGKCDVRFDDIERFSGPDSLTFNTKFSRLKFLMMWLSIPKLRPYIPDSIIYGNNPQL